MKFWKRANLTLDKIINFILVIILLIGIYSIYDTLYLLKHSGDNLAFFFEDDKEDWDKMPKDAVGWLTVDDTNINYPIMQGKDNDEYLNKDPFGQFSLTGSIFLDWRNNKDWKDNYNLLYGHHMSARMMFGQLDSFLDKDFFKKHRKGTLKTRAADYELKIYAVMKTHTNDLKAFGAGEDAASDIAEHIKTTSKIYEDAEGDKILAMSTCQDAGSTERLLVFAKMKKIRVPGTLYDPDHLVQPKKSKKTVEPKSKGKKK